MKIIIIIIILYLNGHKYKHDKNKYDKFLNIKYKIMIWVKMSPEYYTLYVYDSILGNIF